MLILVNLTFKRPRVTVAECEHPSVCPVFPEGRAQDVLLRWYFQKESLFYSGPVK